MAKKQTSRERFPELYVQKSSWVDPHNRTRKVPMRVLCLGMPRTGTASMCTALQMLGYNKCYHMLETLYNPPDTRMWQEAIDAQFYGQGKRFGREQWDQLLGDCQAVIDMPGAAFSESLVASYPDAKVILTTRDVDAWYKSMMETVILAMRSVPLKLVSYIDPDGVGAWRPMITTLFNGYFEQKPFEEIGKKKFAEHYDQVRQLVPEENLLEYRVGEGWARLCEFLDQPMPKEEFPRTNDTKSFGDRMEIVIQLVLLRFLKRAAPIVGALGAGGAALYFWKG